MTESNTSYNKQDEDEVLRAEDIVPPFNTQKHREQSLKETASQSSANQAQQIEDGSSESSNVVRKASEIPKFDLGEQILAAQRKITSVRRKAPGRKTKFPDQKTRVDSISSAVRQPLVAPERDPIISEIVARDIEKLYRGDIVNHKNW